MSEPVEVQSATTRIYVCTKVTALHQIHPLPERTFPPFTVFSERNSSMFSGFSKRRNSGELDEKPRSQFMSQARALTKRARWTPTLGVWICLPR